MEKIYKVFVSSTFEDLREERAEVQKALLKLNCLPVGMELFPASDDETWDFIRGQIADSDYYLLLLAGRYGSIGAGGRSFTEMEYDYAIKTGLPAISFVHEDRGSISRDKSDTDPVKSKKLEEFIKKVKKRPVRYFKTAQQLALEVTTSFVDLKSRKPAIGFVRADQTVDYKKYSLILEENKELEKKIEELSALPQKLPDWLDQRILIEATQSGGYNPKYETFEMSWFEIAKLIAPKVMASITEYDMYGSVSFNILRKKLENVREHSCSLSPLTAEKIRERFILSSIVNVVTEQRAAYRDGKSEPYNARVWKLTETGRSFFSSLRDRQVVAE